MSDAVTIAVWLALSDAVLAVKDADVAAAATATDEGTASAAELSLRVTVTPPAGAGCASVTVQDVLALGPRVFAAHCSGERMRGATSEIVAVCEAPLREAVMVAV